MLKHKKVIAILLSLMMVLCLTPTIAFADMTPTITINGGKDITATVGITEVLQPSISGVVDDTKNYHIHWKAEGSQNKYNVKESPRKIEITANDKYEGKVTKLTAYLYEGSSCDKPYFVKDNDPVCKGEKQPVATSTTVNFSAVEGTNTEDFNSLGIKLKKNGTIEIGTIKKDTVIPVKRWEPVELTASVDNDTDYTFKWTKDGGKEAVNFIDSSGNELSNIDKAGESITGNPIKLKGLVIREGKIKVEALDKDGNTKGSAVFTVKVTSNMKYGQQGYAVSNDPQTIEIVRIGDKIVTDADIDGTKGINNPGDIFKNAITNPFVLDKDTEISFFIGKGMGAKFTDSDLETFISDAMPCIKILDKDGKKIEDLNNLNTEFVSRNTDRSITVKLPTGQLKEGEYLLRFTDGLAAGGQALRGNVDFSFTVAKPVADQPSDSPAEQPGNGQGADNKAEADSDTAETGDNMNIALYAGIMILALCGGAAVFARRRKEQ